MRARTTLREPGSCERFALCDTAIATNRDLRSRVADLERRLAEQGSTIGRLRRDLSAANAALQEWRNTVRVLERERDEAAAEADAAQLYLWQRLPWKGYAS